MHILRIEPDRGGQICGHQIQVGTWSNGGSRFCGDYKAPGLYFCRHHHEHIEDTYGEVPVAPGNVVGYVDLPPVWLPPLWERPVPERSGEAAIYSPAYLERREGPRGGVFLDE